MKWAPVPSTVRVLALLAAVLTSTPASAQSPAPEVTPVSSGGVDAELAAPGSPSPLPAASVDLPGLFPIASAVGDALGLEVEAMGIEQDMSQLWEGIDIAPGALVAKQQQVYLWPPSEAPAPAEDAFAAVSVDIDLFLSAEDAATYGAMIAAAIPGTADTASPTRLSADQVTAGSWASDQGFGGSTIVVTDGAFVILVTAARTGATELQATVEEVAAFIRARIRGEQ